MKYAAAVGLAMSALVLGCSDDREPVPPLVDAAADVVATPDAGTKMDASIDAPRTDGYIDLFDVIPLPEGGCPGCIRDRCGSQINACINDPNCANGLLCTLQMCAGGLIGGDGGIANVDFICVLGCFNGDQQTAFKAIGSLTCVTMTCGGACTLPEAGGGAPDVVVRPDAGSDAHEDVTLDGAAPDPDVSSPPDVTHPPDAADDKTADDAITLPDGGSADAPPSTDATPTSDATPAGDAAPDAVSGD